MPFNKYIYKTFQNLKCGNSNHEKQHSFTGADGSAEGPIASYQLPQVEVPATTKTENNFKTKYSK